MTTRTTIATATTALFDPSIDLADAVDRHFAPSFRRRADDGAWGGRAELIERMTQLREAMASGTVDVHEELVDGPLYADRHTIRTVMKDGSRTRTEVYLFARHDEEGRFSEIQEATVALPADADVASR
jgi:hypothetical protein